MKAQLSGEGSNVGKGRRKDKEEDELQQGGGTRALVEQ